MTRPTQPTIYSRDLYSRGWNAHCDSKPTSWAMTREVSTRLWLLLSHDWQNHTGYRLSYLLWDNTVDGEMAQEWVIVAETFSDIVSWVDAPDGVLLDTLPLVG